MNEPSSQSWDDALIALRQAAGDLKTALGHVASRADESQPTPGRLKHDLDWLMRAGSDAQAKFVEGFERERPDLVSSLDRERAEKTAQHLKSSVEEIAALAADVTADVAAAAQSSLKHAEPELRTAIRSLEDLASSVAAWIATSIESGRGGEPRSKRKPPLDEL
jgi:hypothetical protein